MIFLPKIKKSFWISNVPLILRCKVGAATPQLNSSETARKITMAKAKAEKVTAEEVKQTVQEQATETEAKRPRNKEVESNINGIKVYTVKGIKNSLFKDLEIGGHVLVSGVVRSILDKEGTYGVYTQFKGEFGLKTHEGKIYQANTAYFPEVLQDVLKNGFISVTENAEVGKFPKIEFAVKLIKVENEKAARGYNWELETIKAPSLETNRALALLA